MKLHIAGKDSKKSSSVCMDAVLQLRKGLECKQFLLLCNSISVRTEDKHLCIYTTGRDVCLAFGLQLSDTLWLKHIMRTRFLPKALLFSDWEFLSLRQRWVCLFGLFIRCFDSRKLKNWVNTVWVHPHCLSVVVGLVIVSATTATFRPTIDNYGKHLFCFKHMHTKC